MDVHDDDDDLTDNDEAEGDEAIYRERAAAELDQIARDAKEMLAKRGIEISLFFLIPSSGGSVIVFGTPADPSDDLWSEVGEVVSSIVRQAVGLEHTRCRPVMCASTDAVADLQPSQSPVQPTEPSDCCPTPMPAPALQHTGAER